MNLTATLCRPFTGLVADIKRKLPFYLSDYKDAIHIQCLPATLFIFLATLTNNVAFGALLGQGTGEYMVSNLTLPVCLTL